MDHQEHIATGTPKCQKEKSRKNFKDNHSVTDGGHTVEEL
jgi:hypothetical protein